MIKLRDVLVKIDKNGFNGVFVINKRNKLVGVITELRCKEKIY